MKADDLLDLIGDVDDGIIEEAKRRKNTTISKRVKWGTAAACLVVFIMAAGFFGKNLGWFGAVNSGTESVHPETDAEPTASGLKLRFSLKEEIEMFPYIAKVKIVSDPVPTIAQQYLQEAVLEENFQNMEDSRFTLLVRDNSLKNGSSYVLFLEKQEDVFTGVTSYAYGQKIYTEGDKLFTDTITDIAGLTEEEFIARLKETAKTVSYTGNEFLRGAYIHATDLPTIVSETACIAVVKVGSVQQTGDDRVTAVCTPVETLKGSLPASFQAIVPLDSVKQGDSVLLLLKREDGIYVISSQNSLFPVDSVEAMQIGELLK